MPDEPIQPETQKSGKPARAARLHTKLKAAVTPERSLLGGIITAVLAVGGVFDKKFDELRTEARETRAEQTARIDKLESRLGSKLDKANGKIDALTVKTEVAEGKRALVDEAVVRRFATMEEAIDSIRRATK
jgi:hypothetical protein